jgi:hypothetical protein
MNTLARSLDALLGPAINKRGKKRDIAPVEGGVDDRTIIPTASRKRRRITTAAGDDAGYEDVTTNTIASSASTISRMRLFARPIKQMKRRAVKQQPVKVLNFSRLGFCTLPPTINSLLTEIRRCAKGIDTIPEALKIHVLDQDPDLDSDDDVWQTDTPLLPENIHLRATLDRDSELRWSRTHSQTPGLPPAQTNTSLSEAHNRPIPFSHVEMIVGQARECSDNDDVEAGWDSLVNGPLLLFACHVSRHHGQINSANLTSARPLAQSESDHGAADAGKMVNFGIYLQTTDKLKAAYREVRPGADGESRNFNHMDADPIARKPLVISIETLQGEQRGFQADLKLSLWVKSHFARLADLRKRTLKFGDRTVWLPLLKVVGPVWYLLLACGNYNDEGELFYTTVYSRHQLGDITTYHGFFQVFATLLELINWSETIYRPWFEDWVTSESDQEADAGADWDDPQAFAERSSVLDGSRRKRISITGSGSYEIS